MHETRSRLQYTGLLVMLFVLALILIPALTPPAQAAREPADPDRKAMERTVSAVKPALVRIHVVSVDFDQGREVKSESVGSGVIISREGHVVTNHHVAGDARQISCTLANKEEIDAQLVGTDPLTDIAVIKLTPPDKREFPIARFGDSSKLKVGDKVLAMGSPLAFSQSVTMGVISNTELVMPSYWRDSFTLDGEDVGAIVRWIGHDADIYGGNSGGPLVNLAGEIVGINEIKMGLSGAIPGNLARKVAEQLIKQGSVIRSWVGITVQPLLKSCEAKSGVLIGGVIEGSPAHKAGFQSGDILAKIDGREVSVRFSEEMPPFNQLMADLAIGKEVEAVVLREGKQVSLKVTPEQRADAEAKPRELKQWGICASDLTVFTAKEMKRSSPDGVLVTSLRPGGPCGDAKPSLTDGDIVVEVGGTPTRKLADLVEVTKKITEGKDEPVPTLVAFERENERFLTVVKVGIQDLKDPGREIRKAWLPVSTQVLTTDLAKALGIEGRTGVRITEVYPNTTAEKADLKVGDIIVELDGEGIPASQPEDVEVLPTMIRQYAIGSTAELTVLRGSEQLKVSVELPQSPPLPREMKKYQDLDFDFTVRDIAFLDRVEQNLPEKQTGVLVETVGEGGWASLGNLSKDDLICAVDGRPITDVAAFEKVMTGIGSDKPKSTVFRLKRGIHDTYIELRPSWPQSN